MEAQNISKKRISVGQITSASRRYSSGFFCFVLPGRPQSSGADHFLLLCLIPSVTPVSFQALPWLVVCLSRPDTIYFSLCTRLPSYDFTCIAFHPPASPVSSSILRLRLYCLPSYDF